MGFDAEHDRGSDEPVQAESFAGLADLDEDLRTISQSHAEVERWRRLSMRGRGSERPPSREVGEAGRLVAQSVDPSPSAQADPHGATTLPGTIEAPGARRPDPDETAKLPSIPPEAVAEVVQATRRSFAPPKDSPSAPPGSRVVLPPSPPRASDSAPSPGLARPSSSAPPPGFPRPSSKPPPRVPRPMPRPREENEGVDLRGWRPSDPDVASAAPEPVLRAILPPAMPASVEGPPESSSSRSVSPSAPSTGRPPPSAPSSRPSSARPDRPVSERPPATTSASPRTPLEEPIALTPPVLAVASVVTVVLVALAAWWILR
ncbi:MAG: hypothetical protein OHK0013_08660 [Sandaracinaceae bacterium]